MTAYWVDYGMSYVNNESQFRFPLALQCLFALFTFFAIVPLPESPRWVGRPLTYTKYTKADRYNTAHCPRQTRRSPTYPQLSPRQGNIQRRRRRGRQTGNGRDPARNPRRARGRRGQLLQGHVQERKAKVSVQDHAWHWWPVHAADFWHQPHHLLRADHLPELCRNDAQPVSPAGRLQRCRLFSVLAGSHLGYRSTRSPQAHALRGCRSGLLYGYPSWHCS